MSGDLVQVECKVFVQEKIERGAERAVEVIEEVMNDAPNPDTRLRAANIILEQSVGKPVQKITQEIKSYNLSASPSQIDEWILILENEKQKRDEIKNKLYEKNNSILIEHEK